MRALALSLSAALLNACVWVNPESRAQISPDAVDAARRLAMVQSTFAGPVRLDSVIYKPKYLPLATFLKRLAKGDIADARRMAPFKYKRANVDDRALKTLIKKGYIPVFVQAHNLSAQAVDLQSLHLLLNDSSLALAQ